MRALEEHGSSLPGGDAKRGSVMARLSPFRRRPRQHTKTPAGARPEDRNATRAVWVSVTALLFAAYAASQTRDAALQWATRTFPTWAPQLAIGGEGAHPTTGVGDQLLALRLLVDAARTAAPFETELALTYQLVGADPALERLLDRLLAPAEAGTPTIAELERQYAAMLPTLMERISGEPGLLTSLGGAISSISAATGLAQPRAKDPHVRALLEIADALATQELSRAVEAAERLPARVSAATQTWRDGAQQRLRLNTTVEELQIAVYRNILEIAP